MTQKQSFLKIPVGSGVPEEYAREIHSGIITALKLVFAHRELHLKANQVTGLYFLCDLAEKLLPEE